jgi:hypothetical protein
VLEPRTRRPGATRARAQAVLARARAARAAEVARRHELLAAEAGSEARSLHTKVAELHRELERRHLSAAHAGTGPGPVVPPRFMAAVAASVGGGHVGLSLVAEDRVEVLAVSSDQVAATAQDVEFTVGEGPAHDATTSGGPVVGYGSALSRRWPHFAAAVACLGVRSVAAVPLSTEDGCLGALTVFDAPEPARSVPVLSAVADALVHTALLVPGDGDALDLPVLAGAEDRAVVHQASGMVAVRLGCTPEDALTLLRARAFAENQPVAAIAREIVRRRMTLG